MSYRHHVFVSYCWRARAEYGRRDEFRAICDQFSKLLDEKLMGELGSPSSTCVFIDRDCKNGRDYRESIADALHHSAVLVPILDAPYFSSNWCGAEWEIFVQREAALGLGKELIFPLHWQDGHSFSSDAKFRNPFDMRDHNCVYGRAEPSKAYEDFQQKVNEIARRIASTVQRVPPHANSWPRLEYPAVDDGQLPTVPAPNWGNYD